MDTCRSLRGSAMSSTSICQQATGLNSPDPRNLARRSSPAWLQLLSNAVKQPGRAARIGLWLLPAYGFLLGLSTLTHQPPVADFDASARYVTTDVFLVSHLGASILGAALAVLGVVAVTAYLVSGRAAGLAV